MNALFIRVDEDARPRTLVPEDRPLLASAKTEYIHVETPSIDAWKAEKERGSLRE